MLTHRELTPTPVNEYTQKIEEHLAYLRRMAAENVVDLRLADRARTVWQLAWFEMNQTLPVPAAAAFTGGPIEYHWERETHRASVEIPLDGPCHWFYRNTLTNEVFGVDVLVDKGLPTLLRKYLARLTPSDRQIHRRISKI